MQTLPAAFSHITNGFVSQKRMFWAPFVPSVERVPRPCPSNGPVHRSVWPFLFLSMTMLRSIP
jgi:hypothetical protein